MAEEVRPSEWRRPGDPHDARGAMGTYRVGDDGAAEVTLYTTFGDEHEHPQDAVEPLLFGEVFGQFVTLVEARTVRRTRGGSTQQIATISPVYALEGLRLEAGALMFTAATVRFFNQDLWTGWSAFDGAVELQSGGVDLTVTYKRPATLTIPVEGGTVKLFDSSPMLPTRDPDGWSLTSRSTVRVDFEEPIPLDDVFELWLLPLEFLLVSATGHLTSISSLRLTNREWEIPDVKHDPQRWVQVRTRQGTAPQTQPLRMDLLHLLEDFDLPSQLQNVFDVASQNRYSIEHFVSLKADDPGGYLAQFVAAAQLVESFDQSLRSYETDGQALEARLRRLSSETGGLLDQVVDKKRWAIDVGKVRNIVIHGKETSKELVRDVRSIQVATEILILLFEARLLVAYGFTAEKAAELIRRRRNYWQIEGSIREHYSHLQRIASRT